MSLSSFVYFAAAPAADQPHPIISFLPFIAVMGVFYFLLLRPQQKRQKEHKDFLSNLQKNQEVVTAGGVHGTIVQVKDSTVTLRVADNTKVEFDKTSISRSKKSQE